MIEITKARILTQNFRDGKENPLEVSKKYAVTACRFRTTSSVNKNRIQTN
jgi:hypothetical protein